VSDRELTLHEAAELLGVHYMTAYRYVRLGMLPAEKSGGSWRVARADVEGFRASGVSPSPSGARWAERLEDRLVEGDGTGAWGVVESALQSGMSPDDVYLRAMTPALRSIGDRWETGELDVGIEHRASGIALRLIGRLGPRFLRRGRRRGSVVIGAPAGERHAIAGAMLADLLRGRGWEVSDLGGDVPVTSFVHAASAMADVVAVGLSITGEAHLPSAQATFAAIRSAAPHVLLVAGGAALDAQVGSLTASHLGADAVVADVDAFTALLDRAQGALA